MDCQPEKVPQLTCNNALRALKDNGFITTSHWHQLGSDLGVSLDERRRLREQALIAQSYDVALEECLDIWIRNSKDASWDVLIQAVERLEISTADRMRETIQVIKPIDEGVQSEYYTLVADLIQQHFEELCLAILDPAPVACQLYERRVIDNTYYQAAICTKSLHFKTVCAEVRTAQLLNAIYQTAINKKRVDIVDMFISVLEGIEQLKEIATILRKEYDTVMVHVTVNSIDTHHSIHIPATAKDVKPVIGNELNEVRIDVEFTTQAEHKFDLMRQRFGNLLRKFQEALKSKPVSLKDIKDQLIFSFIDLEEMIEPCQSIDEVIKELRKNNYCSFTNYSIVEGLADVFNLHDVLEEITKYTYQKEEYFKSIPVEDFVKAGLEAHESSGRNSKIVFHVEWEKGQKSLHEFEQMLKAVFQSAHKYIRLKVVKEGSLKLICECPEWIQGALICQIREKEALLREYGVMEITVGEIIVLKKNTVEVVSSLKMDLEPFAEVQKSSSYKLHQELEVERIQKDIQSPSLSLDLPPLITLSEKQSPPRHEAMTHILMQDCEYYWEDLSREEERSKLSTSQNGTFLVRKSRYAVAPYSLVFSYNGQLKGIRIIYSHGKYRISKISPDFNTVQELIEYYQTFPLPTLDIKLEYPVSRYEKVDDSPDSDEEVIDVEEILVKLQDVSKLFDEKNKHYNDLDNESVLIKQEVGRSSSTVNAHTNVLELLTEQMKHLTNCNLDAIEDSDRNKVTENMKLLQSKITAVKNILEVAVQHCKEAQIKFQQIEKEMNTLKPELIRLQYEKDLYTSQLVQEGLTRDEVYELVKIGAVNELDDTYIKLYKVNTLEEWEQGNETLYDYVYNFRESDHSLREQTSYDHVYNFREGDHSLRIGSGTISQDLQLPIVPPRTTSLPRNIQLTSEKSPYHDSSSWYVDYDRDQAEATLIGDPDGTFLCRPAPRKETAKGGLHVHTVSVVDNNLVKHMKVIKHEGLFGFSVPCHFTSLEYLVIYYSKNSLNGANPTLTTTLAYPKFHIL